jgi:glycosyltransferase involved in cell wall biosynthesis
MPGVLIEAGLSTRPAVAFDVGAVSEVVVDGESGALVPAGDVAALAAATQRVLADAGRMGVAARDHCLAHFEIGVVGARWADLVAELAAERAVT